MSYYNDNSGGYGRNNGGGNKRSYDDGDNNGGGGDYKRSRYERNDGGDHYHRPRGGDRRYGGGNDRHERGSRPQQHQSVGESDRERAWRLTKKGIVELGESTTTGEPSTLHGDALRDQLVNVAVKVARELEETRDLKLTHMAQLIVQCAGRLASKTALYAVLTSLSLTKSTLPTVANEFKRTIVDMTLLQLQKDVDFFHNDGRYELSADEDPLRTTLDLAGVALRIRLLLRFLGELVTTRVVKAEDVLSLLDTMQSVCASDDFTSSMDSKESLRTREHAAAYKDYFALVVLDTLLHVGPALAAEGSEDMYDSLLSRCQEYITNREEESNPRNVENMSASNWMERRMRLALLWEQEEEQEEETDKISDCRKCDPLSLLWDAIRQQRSHETTVPGVLYPQTLFENQFTSIEPYSIVASVSIDVASLDETKIPVYEVMARIFDEESGAVGAPLQNLPIASYLITRGHVSDVIEDFYPKPSVAAKHVLALVRGYNTRFVDANVVNLKTEYILLETLFVKALSETTTARLAFYSAVLTHLVRTDVKLMSPAIAMVVELLFRAIPTMNAGAVDAFVKVFSHFLSNFEYKWAWTRWTHVLEASEDDTQRLFVSAVIERCVRLSYLQHMQSMLPADFHVLLPPEPKPRVVYCSDSETEGISTVAKELFTSASSKLKSHVSSTAFQSWVEEQVQTLEIDREMAVEVVFTAILEASAATFTHTRMMLDKYAHLGSFLMGSDEEEKQARALLVVKTVGSVWSTSPQHIGLIVNMLLREQIIPAITIAQWVFTPDAVQQYSWPYVWGIVDDTLRFVQQQRLTAKQQLVTASTRTQDSDTAMPDVHELEEVIRTSEETMQMMLRIIVKGFNRVVTEHKANCKVDQVNAQDNWFYSTLAQLKAIGAKYRDELEEMMDKLYSDVFGMGHRPDEDVKHVFDIVRDSYRSG